MQDQHDIQDWNGFLGSAPDPRPLNPKWKTFKMATLIPVELIASKIYLTRGIKVMLDRDLSELYDVETKNLKRAVRRNIELDTDKRRWTQFF